MNSHVLCLFFGIILLSGSSCERTCAVPLDLPSSAIESSMRSVQDDRLMGMGDEFPDDWWLLFNDPQLSYFIETALIRNPTLQIAETNILLAASKADFVRASLYPNLLWAGDVLRAKLSETGIIPFNTQAPGTTGVAPIPTPVTAGANGIPVYFTQYETELNLSYDFDIWGKNRNTWKAALGDVQSKVADEAFKRLELGISVARTYFQLQIDYLRKSVAEALVENQRRYQELTGLRVAGNLDQIQPIYAANTQLATAKQSLLQIEGDIAVTEDQLRAYLAGNFDEEIYPTLSECQLTRVPIPCDLPVHLLSRRPDITAQLWMIYSAGKQIEVAKAGFYPDFNITAIFGYQTIHLRKLFQYPSTYYDIDPAFSLPIFDGGRLMANLETSEVNYDLAIYNYNQLLINAVKEVLDGLAVLKNSDQQLEEVKNKAVAQEDSFQSTKLRVENNLDSDLTYLVSEQNMLIAKDQEIVAFGNTLQAALSLIKALGGGYMICD